MSRRMNKLALLSLAALWVPVLAAENSEPLRESIDRHIQLHLDTEHLQRAPLADDAEFLRRVFLDLHGVVPSAKRAAEFLADTNPAKRAALIDELLASPQFGRHFGDIWRRYLISPLSNDDRIKSDRFADSLAERFNTQSWDRAVYELLTASGKIEENSSVIYLIEGRHPLGVTDLTDLSCRYFLGIRLNCAQCHDHPFTKWTRDDYWGMASFFTQIQTPGRPKKVYMAGIQDDPKMTMATIVGTDTIEGFQLRSPTFLGGEELDTRKDTNLRKALARWIISPDNPYFARATVNRLWWHFFGRGFVNPVDDMHPANPPSHPELLNLMSLCFVESGFDLKYLCREILNSRTYQQTSRPGDHAEAEARSFARMSIKVISPEQLFDSLVEILGVPTKSRADIKSGSRHEFCQFFSGDGDLDPTRYERGIPHVLRLMNSPEFAGRNLSAFASQIATSERDKDEIVEELYLTILTRRPSTAELELARDHLGSADVLSNACRELAWALLMSSEFTLNH